jgi:hypothetical protein
MSPVASNNYNGSLGAVILNYYMNLTISSDFIFQFKSAMSI